MKLFKSIRVKRVSKTTLQHTSLSKETSSGPVIKIMRKIKYPALTVILLVLIFLAGQGRLDRYIEMCGMHRVTTANEKYLQESFDKALDGFLVLSGIKMGLAVVEGSEVGIGFNLEIGDVVQAAYDYVDVAWHTVLAGAVVLLMTRYLLNAATLIDHCCLAATLLVIVVLLILKWFLPNFRRCILLSKGLGIFMTVLTVTLYLVLPLSITGATFLSEKITAPSIQEAQEGLEKVHKELFAGDKAKHSDLFKKVKRLKQRIDFIAGYLKDKTRELTVWIIKLIAGYVFDCIVFPLGLFLLLFWLTKATAKYLFDVKQRQTLRDDLEEIFKKYRSFHY